MIEEIPRGMREEAVSNAAARRLAEGRSVESVRLDLGKRGWSAVEIEKNWPEIEIRFWGSSGRVRNVFVFSVRAGCWLAWSFRPDWCGPSGRCP